MLKFMRLNQCSGYVTNFKSVNHIVQTKLSVDGTYDKYYMVREAREGAE